MRRKPELLAPAGGMAALAAAVQNGADAVYLGAGDFNARHSAENFAGDALRRAVEYCHARGARVHVTLNTMVRQDELPALTRTVEWIADAGADAALVQDFGVARVVRDVAPQLALHASTQMAVHNRAGVEFLARNGFARAVLAREMTLPEIRACAGLGVELEVFVHGALCVSCSGQCLFSGLVGGRSGNRGRCAQPCRMRYQMGAFDGYLLSTKDLCALSALDDLREAGVDSFKIEGRLKRPEYVAAVTAAYRAAIDEPRAPRDALALQQMFNRGGFTLGYLYGVDDSDLMFPARPNHLGVKIGEAVRDGWIRLDAAADPDDALALRAVPLGEPEAAPARAESPSGAQKGGSRRAANASARARVSREDEADRPVRLSGSAGATVPCPAARRGDRLIRLVSEAQMRAARESASGERRIVPVRARLTLRVGRPASLELSDGERAARATGSDVQAARGRGFDRERAEAQLRKTGGTPYRVNEIVSDADENAFCPVSELNALRRDALDALTQLRLAALRPGALARPESPDAPNGEIHNANIPAPCKATPAPPGGNAFRANAFASNKAAFAPSDGDALRANVSASNKAASSLPRSVSCAASGLPGGDALRANVSASDKATFASSGGDGRGAGRRPAVRVQSGDPERLRLALSLGADGAVFDPRDVRPEALDAAAARLPDAFSLAVPETLCERSLEVLNGWARRQAGRIERVYLSNAGHFALDWPGERAADAPLNAANSLALEQLREWGCAAYTPSVELNCAQIAAMDGPGAERAPLARELIVHGRLTLMRLRHCPWRAAHGAAGKHADCRRCDGCAPSERVDALRLTDRTGASFPLERLATPDGCVVRLLNSVPLMTLRRIRRLPQAEEWRVLADGAGDAEAVVRTYLLAARGEDFRDRPEWRLLEAMPSTTGHYFRGVE